MRRRTRPVSLDFGRAILGMPFWGAAFVPVAEVYTFYFLCVAGGVCP